jgi:carboxyl-terminal processing protease
LKEDKYISDLEKITQTGKKFDSLTKFESGLDINILDHDKRQHTDDTLFINKRNKWIKQLKKDPYLNEAIKVLDKLTH